MTGAEQALLALAAEEALRSGVPVFVHPTGTEAATLVVVRADRWAQEAGEPYDETDPRWNHSHIEPEMLS